MSCLDVLWPLHFLIRPYSSVLGKRLGGFKLIYVTRSIRSISLAFGMEWMAEEDALKRESAKFEPMDSQTEGRMPAGKVW